MKRPRSRKRTILWAHLYKSLRNEPGRKKCMYIYMHVYTHNRYCIFSEIFVFFNLVLCFVKKLNLKVKEQDSTDYITHF